MGLDFILQATNKSFSKEGFGHAIRSKFHFLKGCDILFHFSRFFDLGQMAQMICVNVKAFIKIWNKLSPRNIPSL